MKSRYAVSSVLALCLVVFAAVSAFAAESAGNVIAARRDAWAERPKQEPLAGKSPVYVGDTLITNPMGRLQVLFRDESVLMMAPDSRAEISNYVYGGGQQPSFSLKLARGMTRLISGRMVEGNPGAMKVETPELTVGIQGTRVVVEFDGKTSKVYGEKVTPGLPILITDKKSGKTMSLTESGMVFTLAPGGPAGGMILPMTGVDKQKMGGLAMPASGQNAQYAEAGLLPAPGKQPDAKDAEVFALLKAGTADPNSSLAAANLGNMALIDERLATAGNASIEGTLEGMSPMDTGVYSFNVNLMSGAITNGAMKGTHNTSVSYDLTSGTGSVSGNNFSVSNFQGSINTGIPHSDVGSSRLDGTASKGFNSIGDIGASGTYEIYGNGMSHGTGTITSGRRTR